MPIDVPKQTYMNNGVETDVATGQPVGATTPSSETLAQNQTRAANQGKPGYDALGNPVSAPSASTPSPYYPRYTDVETSAENYLNTFTPPKSAEQLQEEKTKAAQSQIDAANKYYDSLLSEQRTINEGRERGTNAISVLTGLSGSPDALNASTKTSQLNQRDNEKIQNERTVYIQNLLSDIRSSAAKEARDARLDARSDAESILTRRKARLEETTAQLTNLAKSGTTAEGLKATDPEGYAYLTKQAGGEEQLKSIFTLNRPVENILDKRIEAGKYVIAYQNPLTGNVRIESVDLGIPAGYSKTIDAGDRILAVPDDWDGDPSKLISFEKGLSPDQAADNQIARDKLAADKANPGEMTPKQISTAIQLSNSLKSHPAYLDMSDISTGMQGVRIGLSQANGFGDIAAINAFQRMVDPGATVREGDVHLLQSASAMVDKVLSDYPISKLQKGDKLPAAVRERMLKTAEELYALRAKNYNDTIGSQYKSLSNAANVPFEMVGADFEVSGGDTKQSGGGKILIDQSGNAFDASGLTEEEYQQAIDDGYSPQSFNSVGGDTKSASTNRPTRNKNPLNIKASSFTMNFPGVAGTDPKPASDGGKFLTFKTVQDGFNAAKRLIQSDGYIKLTVDAAMKRWSNSGYGGEIVPDIKHKKVAQLTLSELNRLITTMAKREGFAA